MAVKFPSVYYNPFLAGVPRTVSTAAQPRHVRDRTLGRVTRVNCEHRYASKLNLNTSKEAYECLIYYFYVVAPLVTASIV